MAVGRPRQLPEVPVSAMPASAEGRKPAVRARGVALVTGSSRGLGARIAFALAADALMIAVNYCTDSAGADAVVTSIRAAGGQAAAFQGDVTDEEDTAILVRRIGRWAGNVSVLVVNATGEQEDIPVRDLRWEQISKQLEYFIKSPTLLLREVLPGMQRQRFGRIIHLGSASVDVTPSGACAYVAAKSGQLGLARAWARELAPWGITVNTVAPGWVPVERHATISDEVRQAYSSTVPIGRLGRPDDVSAAVSFLASDAAGFITGARIRVDGGLTAD